MTLHDYLFTLLLAMAPVSELRGAIPFGLAHDIPQALLYPSCVLANLLPVPFVILFLRRILAWMQRKGGRLASAADWLEKRGRAKSARIKRSELLGLYLFVAIPLPGTGAWTGALVAALGAQIAARRLKMIATVFVTIAILPLVPGVGLYRAMSALATGDMMAGASIAAHTMALILMIALGIGLGTALVGADRGAKH